MRIGCLLLCLLAVTVCAAENPDPFAGVFQNDQITLSLEGAKGRYSGTVTYQGRSFPVAVRTILRVTTGGFQMDGQDVLFTMTATPDGVQVVANGAAYRLQRKSAESLKAEQRPVAAVLASDSGGAPSSGSIVGSWRNATGYARFNADGTGTIDGNNGRYEIRGDQLTVIGGDVRITAPFQVTGDSLRLTVNGQVVLLNRVREDARGNSIRPELVGKWCWVSVVNANQGARTSSQCFTLQADGSYTYAGETDSYNPYGGATTQEGDAGTWTATETSLTAHSRSRGTTVYSLEKRNHPKNGDPMLVLNGQTFVTYYKKPAW